jgi:hypothetical protein
MTGSGTKGQKGQKGLKGNTGPQGPPGGGGTGGSDIRYKENTAIIDNAVAGLNNVSGIYFNWTEDSPFYEQFQDQRRIGLSAQNIQENFPELVAETLASGDYGTIEDFHSVFYGRMAGVFVQAIKEIDARVKILED